MFHVKHRRPVHVRRQPNERPLRRARPTRRGNRSGQRRRRWRSTWQPGPCRPDACQARASARPGRRIPAVVASVGVRRLADHQAPAHRQERRGALGRDRRRAEAPGDDQIERPRSVGVVGQLLGPAPHHVDPVGQPELVDRVAARNSVRRSVGVEQHQSVAASADSQDQAGEAAAAAQVERSGRPRTAPSRRSANRAACSMWGSTGPGPRKPRSRDRSSAHESRVGAIGADGSVARGSMRPAADQSTGRITTRRRWSSPSDIVRHAVDLVDRVVDDLAVGGVHRLERLLDARLARTSSATWRGEALERLTAALAVAADVDADPTVVGAAGLALHDGAGSAPGRR